VTDARRRPQPHTGLFDRRLRGALLIAGLVPLTLGCALLLAGARGWTAWTAGAAIGLYAALALAVVAFAVIASRRLAGPVQALRDGLRRIGEGELDHRLDIAPGHDAARLASAFNVMAGRVAESVRVLEQTVADRTLALTAVHTVAVTANRSLDPDEILGSVLDRLPVVLNLEAAFIRLLEPEGLRMRAQRGVPGGVLEAAALCPVGSGLSGRVAAQGAPLVADAKFEGMAGSGEAALFREGFRVAACVPITAKSHVFGTLAVASRYPRAFTPQDVQLLTSIGSQIGTALENAGLYERACATVRESEELNRLKTEFLSNVGHELRIPLTAIIGFAELLIERIPGELTPEQERYVRTMLDSGRELLGMINNLLDLSKIKAGKISWHATAVDLGPLIGAVAETVRPLVAKQHLHLAVELDDGPVVAFADEGLVKQVLLNLLSNAVKFTPAGGTVTVRASAACDGAESVEVRVEDTGIGIAPTELDRIFQEFHQVDGSPTRDHPGTGLGLAITKRLVELQGGRVWAESRLGEGSRFTVRLPLGHAPDAALVPPAHPPGIMESVMESLVATAAARSVDARRAPKIVVAASEAVVEQVRHSLEPERYEVQAVAPDQVVTLRARPGRPFAAVIDGRDESGAGASLAALRSAPEIPAVLLGVSDDGMRACAVAAVGVVAVPIAPDTLRAALRSCGVLGAVRRRSATVLVVADTVMSVAVQHVLRTDGVGVQRADPEHAVAAAGELAPDLLLVDASYADPFALAQRLAQHAAARAVPLALAVPDYAANGPWSRLAQQARLAAAGGELLRDEVVGACYRLERALPERAGLVDQATRLYTARYLQHCLVEEVDRAWRLHRPFSIVLFEPDANGRAVVGGSSGSERLLRDVADVLRRHTRAVNPICRYGPSTFAVLLAETSKESARFVAEKLRRLVAESAFPVRGSETDTEAEANGRRVSVSGGVATFFADGSVAEDVIAAARRALRRAKQGGGDRVEAAVRADRGGSRQADALPAGEP
jgi:diguanylate cyclase (GGDEF)-like protein